MKVQVLEADEKHGEMEFVEFDPESYAVFQCDQCSRRIALRPGKEPKFLDQGNFSASHSAWISPFTFSRETYKKVWGMDLPEQLWQTEVPDGPPLSINLSVGEAEDKKPLH